MGAKAVRYFRDPAVSRWKKLAGLGAAAYAVMPFDAIPDVLPLVGWLDDLGVLSAVVWWTVREINKHAARAKSLPRPEDGQV